MHDPLLGIRFFGRPHFLFAGEPFKFSARPKCLPLLAYLLLHRERPAPREPLAFLFWPDATEEEARANLRRHLNYLQNALPASRTPWLVVDSGGVQWNASAPFDFDAEEFERLAIAPETRSRAVELYRGELLEGIDEEWLFAPRERLRTTYLNLLSELVIETRAMRRFTEAIDYAQRMLAADPWREDALRQVIAARYETGDRAGALQTFEAFVRRLRDELDVEPMPETLAYRDAVVRNLPLPGSGPAAPPERERRKELLPFAGRDDELERLRALWNRAASGRGGLVFVAGEAGVGKTRLVAEFGARAHGARILWGTTVFPESTPYQPFIEALRGALGLVAALDVAPLWLSALVPLVPELAGRRTALPPLPAVDPEREQQRLFEALSAALLGLARPRPLLIVLEDLQWAGAATLAALEFLARRLEGAPLLVLATYRDDDVPEALRMLRRSLQHEGLAEHLALGRLRSDAVDEIVARVMPGEADSATASQGLCRASEGNPLFLGELLRDLAESERAEPVPATLQRVIASRVARASDDARSLLDVVAVIGPAFDVDLTRDITGWPEDRLLDSIDELLSRQLLREAGRRYGFDYTFTHHLIAAFVYDELAPEPRRRRHRRIGRAYERLAGPGNEARAGEIARHFELGGEAERAALHFARAARHAAGLYAYEEALGFIARALANGCDERSEIELLLLRETIAHRRGARALQYDDLEHLERFAQGDDELAATVLDRRIALERALGRREPEAELVSALELLAERLQSERWRARAARNRAEHLVLVNRFEEAREIAAQALATHRTLGDAEGEVDVRCTLAAIHAHLGAFGAAREELEVAGRLAHEQGRPRLVAAALYAASAAAMLRHDFTAAIELADSARDVFAELGDREGEADALARSATAFARLGDRARARERNLAAAAIFESIGKRLGVALASMNVALISCRAGAFERAEREFERASAAFEAVGELRGRTGCAVNLACLRLQTGSAQEAKALALEALELATRLKLPIYEAEALANLGAAERDLGELEEAIAHMRAGLARQHDETARASDRVNDLADLALAYLYAGRIDAACAAVDEYLPNAGDAAEASLWPQNFHWVAARVFRAAARDGEWQAQLARARETVNLRAAAISDEAERAAFLGLRMQREIDAAYVSGRWPAAPAVREAKRA